MMFVRAAGKRADGVMPIICRAIPCHRSKHVYTELIMARRIQNRSLPGHVKAKLTVDRLVLLRLIQDLYDAHKVYRTLLQPVLVERERSAAVQGNAGPPALAGGIAKHPS